MINDLAETPEVEIEQDVQAASTGNDAPAVAENEEVESQHEESSEAVESEDDGESTEASGDDQNQEPKPGKRSYKKRIDQLTKKIRERDRFIEEMQNRFYEDQAAQQYTDQEGPSAPPNRETYDDYEKYVEDLAVYKATEALQVKEIEQRQLSQQRQQAQARQQFDSVKDAALDAGRELYDDFEAVATDPSLPLSAVMAEAVLSSDNAPHVWYHLGKNPDQAAEIAQLPPMQQALAIGRLSNAVTATGAKQVSAAPTPPKATKGRAVASNKPNDKISTAEWIKRRNKEIYGR
jgi:hypothetical protein